MIFFFWLFVGPLEATAKQNGWSFGLIVPWCFIHVFMLFWFGMPMYFLAVTSGGLFLIWAAVHILLSGRGRRRWAYLEYGATSLALLLSEDLMSHSLVGGVFVAVGQTLLLTILNLKAQPLWVDESAQSQA